VTRQEFERNYIVEKLVEVESALAGLEEVRSEASDAQRRQLARLAAQLMRTLNAYDQMHPSLN